MGNFEIRFSENSVRTSRKARAASMARTTTKAAMHAKVARSARMPASQDLFAAHSMIAVRVPPQAKRISPVPRAARMAGKRLFFHMRVSAARVRPPSRGRQNTMSMRKRAPATAAASAAARAKCVVIPSPPPALSVRRPTSEPESASASRKAIPASFMAFPAPWVSPPRAACFGGGLSVMSSMRPTPSRPRAGRAAPTA